MTGARGIGGAPRPGLKRRLLRAAQTGLAVTGAARLYGRRRGANRVTVLMYHSVPPPSDAPFIAPRNRMSVTRFEGQMRFLAGTGRVTTLAEALARTEAGEEVEAGTVVLTFDDGYRDNLTVVAPVLARYGLPAVLYLATGYVGAAENQWADRLFAAFTTRSRDRLAIDDEAYDLSRPGELRSAYSTLSARLLSASRAQREELLAGVEGALAPRASPPRLTLTWEEARRIREVHSDFSLGIHTSGHVDLSALDTEEAAREIDLSIREFTENLGEPPEHFSYPYSRVHPELGSLLKDRGIRWTMGGEGVADLTSLDPTDVPRLEAPSGRARLSYLVSGAHPDLSRRLFGRA